jgi:hypothetical protein
MHDRVNPDHVDHVILSEAKNPFNNVILSEVETLSNNVILAKRRIPLMMSC